MRVEGKYIHFEGPPVDDEKPQPIRVNLGDREAPKKAKITLTSKGSVVAADEFDIDRLPRVRIPKDIFELVALPEMVSPGDTITFTAPDTNWTPRFGEWRIGGRLAYGLDWRYDTTNWDSDLSGETEPETGDEGEDTGEPDEETFRYTVTLPYDLNPDLGLSLKYDTYWKEPVIELDEVEGVEIVPQPTLDPVLPRITACTPKSFAGEEACVCGWFPDQQSRGALTLDGIPLGAAVSASNRVVTVRLPSELAPGKHVIAGNGLEGSAEIVILAIGGEVDQELLRSGQSTPIKLWVYGTDEPVELHLTNHTPGIVTLQGGNDQVVTTSGGSGDDNTWQGILDAVSPGDFNLSYELTVGGCPCGEGEVVAAEDMPDAGTPYGETIDSFRRARRYSNDARYGSLPPTEARDRAQRALDEFEHTREELQEAIDAWNNGDLEGGIGPTVEQTLRRFISEYEDQARGVLESTPAPTTGTTTTTSAGTGTVTGTTVTDEPDGDDPRDSPPPVTYGEELDDPRIGVLLFRDDSSWIPQYNNETTVTAKIYEPDPTRPRVWLPSATRKGVIKVFFVRRSNEKGRDLNTILNSDPEDSPDVLFKRAKNPRTRCEDDPVGTGYFGSCTTLSAENEYKFTITSEDYGSFSALDVSCDGCVSLVGVAGMTAGDYPLAVEEADQNKRLVDVPKDTNKNQISDGYRPDQLWIVDASEDNDNVPVGNGVKGDGFSAYEEYRGFHNKELKHTRTSWNTKDLFVENPMGFVVQDFMKASDLHVHEITVDQHKNRVINFNKGHANVVEQHGLVMLARYTSKDALLGMVTKIGPPKNVEEVKIFLRNMYHYTSRGRVRGLTLNEVVAHELGHAVAIRHHGQTGTRKETWYPPGGLSELSPLHNTHTRPVMCGVRLPGEVLFGEKHNQSSGNLTCFMRYKGHGDAFEQENGTIDCAGADPDQTIFCESKTGTAWNAGNRVAGDATKGDCKGQIQVNDGS